MNTLEALRSAVNSGRFPHAVVLTGTVEADKASAVLLLSQSAVCEAEARNRTTIPCGTCGGCRKAAKGEHPDILTVVPDEASASGEIKIAQIRAARAELHVRANEAPRRVLIIQQADRMNAAAQNALLQVLEEPPAATLFILETRNDAALLPTVKSRAQTFRFDADALRNTIDVGVLTGAVRSRERIALAEGCAEVAKLKGPALAAFLDAARSELKHDIAAAKILTRALEMCDANVTAAQISGWLLASMLQLSYK